VTSDSLIVSGKTTRGYYIFQLVELIPDQLPAKLLCPIAA